MRGFASQVRGLSGVKSFSRRQFLNVAGGLGLTLWLQPPSKAAASREATPEFTFALVTDIHLRRGGSELQSKELKTVVQAINASPAEFTLFCGDLVDHGEKPENEKHYREWVDIASGLTKPYRAIPGNHDPDALFVKHVQRDLDFTFEHERYCFLCFRDAEPNPGHDGIVTKEQLDWMQDRIRDAVKKRQRVVLAAHVIFHQNMHPDVGWMIKGGRKKFARFLAANAAHIDAFFAGHFHCGLRGWSDSFGIHEVVLPALSRNRNRRLEKAGGYSLDDFRNGYVLASVHADRIVLVYHPVAAEPTAKKELPTPKR